MIDWGAYLDGSMDANERAQVESRLEAEESLRQELAGYQAFVQAVKLAGQNEFVPTERLREFANGIGRAPTQRFPRFALGGLALAVVAVAAVLIVRSRTPMDRHAFALASTPAVAGVEVTSAVQAADWVRKHTEFTHAPIVSLGPDTRVLGVRRGEGWAAYDLRIGPDSVAFTMAKSDNFGGLPTKIIHGQTFYLTGGLGWRQNGMSYQLSGCSISDICGYAWAAHESIAGAKDSAVPGDGRRTMVSSPACVLRPSS